MAQVRELRTLQMRIASYSCRGNIFRSAFTATQRGDQTCTLRSVYSFHGGLQNLAGTDSSWFSLRVLCSGTSSDICSACLTACLAIAICPTRRTPSVLTNSCAATPYVSSAGCWHANVMSVGRGAYIFLRRKGRYLWHAPDPYPGRRGTTIHMKEADSALQDSR